MWYYLEATSKTDICHIWNVFLSAVLETTAKEMTKILILKQLFDKIALFCCVYTLFSLLNDQSRSCFENILWLNYVFSTINQFTLKWGRLYYVNMQLAYIMLTLGCIYPIQMVRFRTESNTKLYKGIEISNQTGYN